MRYKKTTSGDTFTLRRVYRIRCCDCGLVHQFHTKVLANNHVRVTVYRMERPTRAARRTRAYAGLKLPYRTRR